METMSVIKFGTKRFHSMTKPPIPFPGFYIIKA